MNKAQKGNQAALKALKKLEKKGQKNVAITKKEVANAKRKLTRSTNKIDDSLPSLFSLFRTRKKRK